MLLEAIAEEWARATHVEPAGAGVEARRRNSVPLRKRGSLDTVVDIVPAP